MTSNYHFIDSDAHINDPILFFSWCRDREHPNKISA